MQVRVSSNIDAVMKDFDALESAIVDVAMPRALNELRDQAQVAGLREIASQYDVGPRTMEKYVSVKFATAADLEAKISVKGRGFPLADMRPRQTRAGVTVSIKGKRILVPHAFMVAKFGEHVFARGGYQGKTGGVRPTGEAFGRFQFGKGRLPLGELFTFGPVEAFGNAAVTEAMNDRVDAQAGAVLKRELRFAAR